MATQRGLRSEQRKMSSALYVEEAAGWAHALTLSRCREPGDYDRAMRSLVEGDATSSDPKILKNAGYSTLRGFRYRQPKRVFADVYFELKRAYDAMREHQLLCLETELAEAKAAGVSPDRMRAVERVVSAARG